MSAAMLPAVHGQALVAASPRWAGVLAPAESDDWTWHQADERTRKIAGKLGELKTAIEAVTDLVDEVTALLEGAWAMRADLVLGYPDFEAYVAARFGSLGQVRLPIPERVQLVLALYGDGDRMSKRGAARVLCVDEQTMRADLRRHAAPAPVIEASEPVIEAAMTKPAAVLAALVAAGPAGCTAPELDRRHRWPHGRAGAVLSELHTRHRVSRVGAGEPDGTRAGFAVYVVDQHLAGRLGEQPGRRSRAGSSR